MNKLSKTLSDISYSITLDIDWAPDIAISYCLDVFDKYRVKALFFATHHTDLNQEILQRGHQLGIHPNFYKGSSHGENYRQVMDFCMKLVPEAKSLRTHGLYQSSNLFEQIFGSYRQLKIDLSLFMHRSPYVHEVIWELNDVQFKRIIYNWEDDVEFKNQRYEGYENMFFGKYTIFNFHPIHIALNSFDGTEYKKLKNENNNRFSSINEKKLMRYINHGNGIESFLIKILNSDAKPIEIKI